MSRAASRSASLPRPSRLSLSSSSRRSCSAYVCAPARLAAAAAVFVVAVACFAALGFAVLAVVRRTQTVIAVTLGSLLSLSFISDVFVIGVTLPRPLEVVGNLLPLRHASHALTATVTGGAAPWADLAVLLAWTAAGLLIARRIRWVES